MNNTPTWLAALGGRGGPLTRVAARFLEDRLDARDAATLRGKDALAFLAKALDAHVNIVIDARKSAMMAA